jgi:hypothetical protein
VWDAEAISHEVLLIINPGSKGSIAHQYSFKVYHIDLIVLSFVSVLQITEFTQMSYLGLRNIEDRVWFFPGAKNMGRRDKKCYSDTVCPCFFTNEAWDTFWQQAGWVCRLCCIC